MKILTRYILGEVISHAAIGAGLFTFVIFMRDLGRLLELIVRNSAPLPSVAEIFFLTLPTAFTITIPMGVLVGILIGLSRLSADSEVTAMRAGGVGVGLFVRSVAIFAVITWALAMVNGLWVAPASAAALERLQDRLKNTQASFEVQPRVFYEDFKNTVLYVEDVRATAGAAVWRGVFLADLSNPASPRITVAQRGVVINEGVDRIHLHLTNGSQHEVQPKDPSQYSISSFAETDIPIQLTTVESEHKELVPVSEMPTPELWYRSLHPEANPARSRDPRDTPEVRARWYRVEFHRRLALPTSCLVLALVGIPLGLSSRKGGKSMGFVLTIVLVFIYYFISLSGISFGRSGKLPPGVGVWMANFVFLVAGILLTRRVDRAPIDLSMFVAPIQRLRERWRKSNGAYGFVLRRNGNGGLPRAFRRNTFSSRFPLLLDELILRDFALYFGMILVSFILLTLIFTFFELLGDIVRNHISLLMLGEYLLNLAPSMIYLMTPLSVLLAVLITYGLMQKSSEITAFKASGVSVYRLVVPVLLISAAIAAGLFFFDQYYVPKANKRQETLHNQIKGKPAQTYLRPDRKWIFGENNTIYYYSFFDPDRDRFANLTLFKLDPGTFALEQRIFAARAYWDGQWVFRDGWVRNLKQSAIVDYRTFGAATFPAATEPPSYFKKEVHQSQEMNYQELSRYIADLRQGGFEVVRLRVQLYKKLAYPLITFIMAVLAIPYSLGTGRKGALTGIAIAIGVAVVYYVAAGIFEAMGNTSQLPVALAAWAPDILFGLLGGYLLLKTPT